MKRILAIGILLSMSAPALAGETLNLYSDSRSAYLSKYESQKEQYKSQGQTYIDKVYQSGHSDDSAGMIPEDQLDAFIDANAEKAASADSKSATPPSLSKAAAHSKSSIK